MLLDNLLVLLNMLWIFSIVSTYTFTTLFLVTEVNESTVFIEFLLNARHAVFHCMYAL